IVEGIEGGERFAVITKVHHCMIDGMSSVDLLEVLLKSQPTDTIEPGPRWIPRPAPRPRDLLWAEAVRRASMPFDLVRGFRRFRVMAPVSVRTREERGTFGNRVSAWMIDLPLAERDPRRRLEKIREQTERLKESKHALGAEMLTRVVEWTPSTLLSLGGRMVTRALPFNLVVTNVPGPQVPLYLLGARMLDNYGQVPLTDYLGLGIVLFSYAGTLCWGFTADWD